MADAWRAGLTVQQHQVDPLEDLLGGLTPDMPPALSSFRLEPGTDWRVEAIFADAPALEQLVEALHAAGFDTDAGALEWGVVPPIDWVAESLKHHVEVKAGRFHIYGSHHAPPPNSGRIGIHIDAATAFGTGQHATTHGCLEALTAHAKHSQPRSVLDLGTGSGVLAIAAWKLWRAQVIGTDIDATSVDVAAENAVLNLSRTQMLHANGLAHPALNRKFDLIVANILAGPLCQLAGDIVARLSPGGTVILSGLLASQSRMVLAAYRGRGLRLMGRFERGEWHTLVCRQS